MELDPKPRFDEVYQRGLENMNELDKMRNVIKEGCRYTERTDCYIRECPQCEVKSLYDAGYRLIKPERLTVLRTTAGETWVTRKSCYPATFADAYNKGASDQLQHTKRELGE